MRLQIELPLHAGSWLWSNSEPRDFNHGDLNLDEVSSWERLVSEVKDKQAWGGQPLYSKG